MIDEPHRPFSSIVLALALAAGCSRPGLATHDAGSSSLASEAVSARPPAAATSSTSAPEPAPLRRVSGAASAGTGKVRDIHLRSGMSSTCVEMYSLCTRSGTENLCTSAPLHIECGEIGVVPATGERLRCVCP